MTFKKSNVSPHGPESMEMMPTSYECKTNPCSVRPEEDVKARSRTPRTPPLWLLICAVWVWAYFGYLTRAGLTLLELELLSDSSEEEALKSIGFGTGFYFSNVVGSILLGMLSRYDQEVGADAPVGRKGAWHFLWKVNKTGFGTGFCGSCTTFATWNVFVSRGFFEENHPMSSVFTLITCLSIFYSSFIVGQHLAHFHLGSRDSDDDRVEEATPNPMTSWCYDCFGIEFLIWQVWVIAVVVFTILFLGLALGLNPKFCNVIFAGALLAPFGANLRFLLGTYNKKPAVLNVCHIDGGRVIDVSTWDFPAFTFAANILGCILLAITVIAESSATGCGQNW
eukprot:CAMPEP_0114534988 /NCGR_PEP_ID=MMETSP0109-20121206/28154_1 /TAXON_ID=29199 /ORGANISM="Chlorarachnion reptans, Strain CCCM449" /LENGTH=337 /DNA_ID=CAMNT_0001718479 /DNA_START=81 /DNA_END=1091 /DNA_ORIENTATION=-